MSGPEADILVGNALPLKNIPAGTIVHNIELRPGKGAQMARSAGAQAQVVSKETEFCLLKLPSGEVRKYQDTEHNVERFNSLAARQERRCGDKQNRNNIEHKQGVPEPHPAESFALIKLSCPSVTQSGWRQIQATHVHLGCGGGTP